MQRLHLDFETRSISDLPDVGSHIYAMHPSTEPWCMAYAFGDDPIQLWVPGEPCPPAIVNHIKSDGIIVAHNAAFERVIFNYVMGPRFRWPVPKMQQWRCTMAMAYAMALPGKLEEAAPAAGLPIAKDMTGKRLMLKMSKPRKKLICSACGGKNPVCFICEGHGFEYTWWNGVEDKARLYTYCRQDVEVERQLEKRLLQLRPMEQKVWELDQEINDRGVYIDDDLCNKALKVVETTKKQLDEEMRQVTKGEVSSCSAVSALLLWLRERIDTPPLDPADYESHDDYAEDLLYADHDAFPKSISKDVISELLGGWDLLPEVRRALELRQEAAKTSTAKIKKMLTMRAADGRMRGNLQYHGAGTGRWAARGAQLQNLPRPKIDDVPGAIDAILTGSSPALIKTLYGPPLSVVSDCIRGMIKANTGYELIAADFSNIEGRGIAWLAGEEDKLDAFRAYDAGTGPDLYLVAAAKTFGISVDDAKPFRQIGKVEELSLGYQGGPKAFAKMAGNYGLHIGEKYDIVWEVTDTDTRDIALHGWEKRGRQTGMDERSWLAAEVIKLGWRQAHPNIVTYWRDLETAAVNAVSAPGTLFTVGVVGYKMAGSFLWCRLPSGRTLCYPYPRLVSMVWVKRKDETTEVMEAEEAEQLQIKGELIIEASASPKIVYKCVDGLTRKWKDKNFYGGLAAENNTQAVARDIMVESMFRVEAAGYPLILTVHDEDLCEVAKTFGSVEQFESLMSEVPAWAPGFPISVGSWRGERYRK